MTFALNKLIPALLNIVLFMANSTYKCIES